MAINIKGVAGKASPHGQAAAKMGDPAPTPPTEEESTSMEDTEQQDLPLEGGGKEAAQAGATVTTTKEKDEQVISQEVVHEPGPLVAVPKDKAVVKIGLSFKFPIADYTMIGFEVGVEYPCDPEDVDSAFDAAKDWAEERLNSLIEAQQAEQNG